MGGSDEPGLQLARLLAPLDLLLVLDNFEQLLDASPLLSTLLAHCPSLQCLVTSREVLNLHEEWLFPLEGLEIEADSAAGADAGDAVQLFAARARRVRRPFDLSAELPYVVEICRLAGGMPLAIELAASWTKSLPCSDIAAEIRRSLAFLTTTVRNVPERHRSVHAALDASWQRLSSAEQAVFCRLSAFRGGFQRVAVEQIAGASVAILTTFVDRSLVHWDPSCSRYMLHELVRQYAAERLAAMPEEEEATRNTHYRYFIEFLHARTDGIDSFEQPAVLVELDAELDNIRAAWARALELRDLDAILRAVYTYYDYYDHRGRSQESVEAFGRVLAVLESVPDAEPALAYVLAFQGWNLIRRGDLDAAWTMFERIAAIYDRLDRLPVPGNGTDPLTGLGMVADIRGDYAQAAILAEAAFAAAPTTTSARSSALYVLANARLGLGELDAARTHAQAAYSIAQGHGNLWFMGYLLTLMGDIERAEGDTARARQYYREGYSLKERLADPEGMAAALNQLGRAAWLAGDYPQAEHCHLQAFEIYCRLTDPGGLAACHHGLGSAAAMRGDLPSALVHYRQALEIALGMDYLRLVVALLADGAAILGAAGDATAGRVPIGRHPGPPR